MRSVVYTMESRRWNKSFEDLSPEIQSTPLNPPPGYSRGSFSSHERQRFQWREGVQKFIIYIVLCITKTTQPSLSYFYLYLIIHPMVFYHSPKQLISISLMISSISSLFLSCSLIISSSSLFIGTGQTAKQQNNKWTVIINPYAGEAWSSGCSPE